MDPTKTQKLDIAQAVAGPQAKNHAVARLGARYDVLGEIGRGGMGVVYKVRDRETQEIIAAKVLRAEIGEAPNIERFKNELRLARRITHKNVCRIYDFNREDALVFITMEYVEGESLRALLDRFKTLAPTRAREIAGQICAGLREAHAQGIIHRDLKPENVMLDRAGQVKLMDFGIARSMESPATTTRAFIGTPAYMAPEQVNSQHVDQRTDIYALGLILYECVTGQRPFSGDTPIAVAMKQVKEKPLPPRRLVASIPYQFEAVILRCLDKDPNNRFATAELLQAALADPRAPLAPAAAAVLRPSPRVVAPPVHASRGWLWLGVIAVVVVIAGFVVREKSPPLARVTAVSQSSPTLPTAPAAVAREEPAPRVQAEPQGRADVLRDVVANSPELRLLRERAENGDVVALTEVGVRLLDGRDVPQSASLAARAFRRAAEQGYGEAQDRLGQLYESGNGVKRDLIEAHRWYALAARNGYADASAHLEKLAGQMDTRQTMQAKRRARLRTDGNQRP